MTIPKLTPYTGQVANPDGSQTQSEFTQNMFDQLSYEAQLATQLDATIDGMNNAVDEVEANAVSAQNSANAAEAAASSSGYQGLWPDTGGSADKGDTYQTQVGGTPTGEYFTALQNTTVDPVGDNVNWKVNISASDVRNPNLLSNGQFKIASPDDSLPAPSATPQDYPAGFEIFSGWFADDVNGASGVTRVNEILNWTQDGVSSIYTLVTKDGDLTEYIASLSGKVSGAVTAPDTSHVSFSDNGDGNWRITIANSAADIYSCKFEQGSVATGYRVNSELTLSLGAQSTTMQKGTKEFRLSNTNDIIYIWEPSGDFGASQQTVTDIYDNDQGGFDVVTNIQTYEFTTSEVRRMREAHNIDGWNIKDDGLDKKTNVESMLAYSGFNEITWHKRAKCNAAQYGEFLNVKFCGDGEIYTDLTSTTNPDGSLNVVGACLISTTAKKIRSRYMKASGSDGVSSAISIYCDSPDLISSSITYSEYVDCGHWIVGGIDSVARSSDNEFRSSDCSGADAGRNGSIPFERLSVGGEDWAAQDEPRIRTGRMFVRSNDFKVWCSAGSNKDLAKYTGLCEAPQIVNNIFHNFNKSAEAEVDTYTAGYRAKIDNDHKNCSLKNQTLLGALSGDTTSAPLTEFTRIGGSYKFEPQSVNLFGILARGGYFLIENYVIDWKRDTATTDFNAVHVRSSDAPYYNGNGTIDAVNFKIGSGLIDLRCSNYAGFAISPFNEFTSKENYNIDGPIVYGGNGKVINGIKNGSMSNTKIYYADDYDALTVDGPNLFAEGNLMLDADGSHHTAAYAKSTQKNNFMDSVATEIDVSTLTGGVLDVSGTGDIIDLVGTGTISSIIGAFRSGKVTLRLKSGQTTVVDSISEIVLSSGGNIVMNSSRHLIKLESQTPNQVWYQIGGTL